MSPIFAAPSPSDLIVTLTKDTQFYRTDVGEQNQ